jgi:TonB family protein
MRVTPRHGLFLTMPLVVLAGGCGTAAPSAPAPVAPSRSSSPAAAVDISKVEQRPAPRFQARPQYPAAMREKKIGGEVVVDFIVDVNGDVRNAYALRSSRREFEAAAVAAVEKWKFKPGMIRGRAVPTHMQVPIVFTLNEETPAAPTSPPGVTFEVPKTPMLPDTFDIAQLDVTPVPRFQARPQYPFALRRDGVAGEAVTDFVVDTEGNVQRAYALRATHPAFADAAVAAVMQWKFRPGKKGGRVVNTHMQVPIVFTLNQQ